MNHDFCVYHNGGRCAKWRTSRCKRKIGRYLLHFFSKNVNNLIISFCSTSFLENLKKMISNFLNSIMKQVKNNIYIFSVINTNHYQSWNFGIEIQETMHIPTHLFSMLKSCQQHAKFDVSLKILLYLVSLNDQGWFTLKFAWLAYFNLFQVENQQCGKQFLWKMFANFLQKDCAFFLPLFSDLAKVLSKSLKVHHDEWRLFYTVLLLNKEMYDKAHKEACNFDGNY